MRVFPAAYLYVRSPGMRIFIEVVWDAEGSRSVAEACEVLVIAVSPSPATGYTSRLEANPHG
ncbi:MAG: hypothetical protein MZV63_20240 [Marinilabiliales bacterium]|nr:hypothetical protein [Marinilabiliales bacterium]